MSESCTRCSGSGLEPERTVPPGLRRGPTLRVYQAIEESILTLGYSPTIREMCEMVGSSSTSTVLHHVNRLVKMGLVRRLPGRHGLALAHPGKHQ